MLRYWRLGQHQPPPLFTPQNCIVPNQCGYKIATIPWLVRAEEPSKPRPQSARSLGVHFSLLDEFGMLRRPAALGTVAALHGR